MSAAKRKCPQPVRRKALRAERRSDYINFCCLGPITKKEALESVLIAVAIVAVFLGIIWGTAYIYGIFRGWWG